MRNMGDMNRMMKQAREMQEKFMKMQEEVKKREVTASSGGGAVTVTANGAKEVIDVRISRELLESQDAEMTQDLVKAAVNEAMNKAQQMMDEETKKLTGGFGLPGMP